MAKKIVHLKKAKKVAARKAAPKKKVKAVATSKAKDTPKKKVRAVPANKKVKGTPTPQAKKKAAARKAPKKLPTKKKASPGNAANNAEAVAQVPEGGPVAANERASNPDLRQRVAALLNKLDDDTLQWLHFEMTDPDAEGAIETDEEAEEATANFPPLNRPALCRH